MRKIGAVLFAAAIVFSVSSCGPSADEIAAEEAAIEAERNTALAHNTFHEICVEMQMLSPRDLFDMDWDATGGKVFQAQGYDASAGEGLVNLRAPRNTTISRSPAKLLPEPRD